MSAAWTVKSRRAPPGAPPDPWIATAFLVLIVLGGLLALLDPS